MAIDGFVPHHTPKQKQSHVSKNLCRAGVHRPHYFGGNMACIMLMQERQRRILKKNRGWND